MVRPISVSYQIDKILEKRNKLAEIFIHEAEGHLIVGEKFQKLVDIAYEELPGEIHYASLYESIRPLADTTPTAKTLTDLAHRLAGNVHNLKAHRAALPWSVQRHWEWVPMVVVSARRAKNSAGTKFGATLTFKIVAGTACTMMTQKFWSNKQCAYMAHHFGFSKPPRPNAHTPPKFPYISPEQYTTLRVYGLLDPHKSSGEIGPVFDKIRFPPSVLAFNREQLKYRARIKGYECPNNYPLTVLCHQCPVGYEDCRAGCHAKTYVTRDCALCTHAAPFDPDQQSPFCVNCTTKAIYKKD